MNYRNIAAAMALLITAGLLLAWKASAAPSIDSTKAAAKSAASKSATSKSPVSKATGSTTAAAKASAGKSMNLASGDWPWWRGSSRDGHVAGSQPVPTKFGDAENVVWQTPVPGAGHSSPIVIGDLIILTTHENRDQSQSVLAFDRRTGKPQWKTEISHGGLPEKIHPKNSHATPTAASDGERIFVSFHHHNQIEIAALDLRGKVLWKKSTGRFDPQRYVWGYAPSPIIYEGFLIVSAEWERGFLMAFDRGTGKEAWRTSRGSNISYSTPQVATIAGRDQLMISGDDHVASYNPATGKSLWSVTGTAAATCGTAVWDGDIVFASGGYPKSDTVAIRASGDGEAVWHNNQKCYEQSMLAHDGHLYALTGTGIAYCWRASDGQEMWKQRLSGPVSASPILVNGNIYWANERGVWYVYRASPSGFELVSENRVGEEGFASPAVSDGQIIVRTASSSGGARQETLYCFGNK